MVRPRVILDTKNKGKLLLSALIANGMTNSSAEICFDETIINTGLDSEKAYIITIDPKVHIWI